MPALKRGSRPKAAPRQATRGRAARPAAYAPAKLRAAQGVGLRPGLALGLAAAVVALGLCVALSSGDRLELAMGEIGHGAAAKLARLGFRVDAVQVEGASPEARTSILRAARIERSSPILDVDLPALRRRIETVGWVKTAKVVRLLPDTVVISVDQRRPVAVWQHNGHARVIDESGHPIAEADPMRYADLPLVVGEGANDSAADILRLVRARPQLMSRLEALVRVDDRRWDIRLIDGGLVQLPARDEESALIQLDQLDQKARILELGFERIDLRDPEMVAVRPRETAAAGPVSATIKGA
jgi:cell division protein FtsQ